MDKNKQKKKKEFSQIMCVVGFTSLLSLGIWMIDKYQRLMELAISSGSEAVPDSALPIAGITMIVSPILSYLLYQAGLKNSRNKYGVDENGEPYKRDVE